MISYICRNIKKLWDSKSQMANHYYPLSLMIKSQDDTVYDNNRAF